MFVKPVPINPVNMPRTRRLGSPYRLINTALVTPPMAVLAVTAASTSELPSVRANRKSLRSAAAWYARAWFCLVLNTWKLCLYWYIQSLKGKAS
ncbi:MAG: hypothetical protein AAGE59_32270 [Cyanobacteria bacterium P01_F01_bin.86]